MNPVIETWLRRGVWLIIAISLGWIAYTFAYGYRVCRLSGTGEITCFWTAATASFLTVVDHVVWTITRLLRVVLP